MKRRILSTLLALCLVLEVLPASAYAEEVSGEWDTPYEEIFTDAQEDERAEEVPYAKESEIAESAWSETDIAYPVPGGIVYFDLSTGTVTLGGLNENSTELVIPDTINGVKVAHIGEGAFRSTGITNIIIPNSVISIGKEAFASCHHLTNIVIPDGITKIEDGVFWSCDSLSSITLPNRIISIGRLAFMGCSALSEITIPNSVTIIGEKAFSHCEKLNTITIPDTVSRIGDEAFRNCPELTSIDLPSHLTHIGKQLFDDCKNLTNITIPGGITEIGWAAFRNCSHLSSISFPNLVETIEPKSFENCVSLQSIVIPNNVVSLGEDAFGGCLGLRQVILPASLDCYRSFSGCTSITNVKLTGYGDMCNNDSSVLWSPWNQGSLGGNSVSVEIEDGVTSIGDGAFSTISIDGISSISIPESVTRIGSRAFSGCKKISNINIPNSVTIIDKYAFYGCSSLTDFDIPHSVKTIGTGAFENCVGLSSIIIPNSVASLGSQAFSGCTSLKDIAIPASLNANVFRGCTSATDITLTGQGNMVDYSLDDYKYTPWYIGSEAGNSITVKVEDGITSIGAFAFENCRELTDFVTPNTVTAIGRGAFSGCSGLTSFAIPNGITKISEYTFSHCTNLKAITIPSSVTSVEVDAFADCESLADIYYAGNQDQWKTIYISLGGSQGNKILKNPTVTIHYNSTGPDQPVGPGGDITFRTDDDFTVEIGKELELVAMISDAAGLQSTDIVWSSSDESIATVRSNGALIADNASSVGYVKGIAGGTVTITVSLPDGRNGSCQILVKPSSDGIQLSGRKSLLVGDNTTLSAELKFDTIFAGYSLTWTSSNGNVLAFDEAGATSVTHPISGDTSDSVTIYARGSGKAEISCELSANGAKQVVNMSVYTPEQLELQKLGSDWFVAYNGYISSIKEELTNASKTLTTDDVKSHGISLEKKLESQYGIQITGVDKEGRQHVCVALLEMLGEEVNTELALSGISTKKPSLVPVKIVTNVASALQQSTYHYKNKDANVTIDISSLGFTVKSGDKGTGRFGHAVYRKYKSNGSYNEYIVTFVSSKTAMEQVVQDYMEELVKFDAAMAKQAAKEILKEFKNALFGKGATSLSERTIKKLSSKYSQKLMELGLGDVPKILNSCYNYCKFAKKIAEGDFTDLFDMFSGVKDIDFSDPSLEKNGVAATKKALESLSKEVRKIADSVEKAQNKKKEYSTCSSFNCPVDITVFNSSGQKVGFVGESDLWYDEESIYMEQIGETKAIYSNEPLIFELTATDYGTLNCTFEGYVDGEATGRINYFDIPLYTGKTVSAKVPGDNLSEKNIIVTEAEMGTIPVDEIIFSGEYESSKVHIACKIETPGSGQIFGSGDYIRGDAVKLHALVEGGYVFLGWRSDDGDLLSILDNYEFIAKENVVITALIVEDESSVPELGHSSTIAFNANGGEVELVSMETDTYGKLSAFPTPIRTGYASIGWYTASNGGDLVTTETVFTTDTTIYAHWIDAKVDPPSPNIFTIVFDSNGGAGTMADITTTENIAVTLPTCTFVAPTGKTFKAWQINGEEYIPGETYTFTADTMVIAIWQDISVIPPIPTTYTITFDPTGGITSTSSMTTGPDGRLVALPTAIRDSYTFAGWYTAPAGGERISTDTVFSSDTTVYAHWSYAGSNEGGPTGGGWVPSGDSSSPATYRITVPSVSHGTVTANPKSAAKGSTVTITATPDSGYELTSLTVTDSRNNKLELTDKGNGRYTFAMPNSAVTVDAVFEPVQQPELLPEANPAWVNPFTDVTPTSWYYDAVKFVSENHLMNGVGSNLFAPDAVLSRAQMAQVLYNKEGNPTVSGSSIFTDVPVGAWYADAIAWVSGKNIVGGYGNGTFGPNDSVTREQLAVMLWRYAGEPVSGGELSFTDAGQVSDYALTAIRWAVKNGVLNGTGNGVLDPKGYATRAQVAQMLKNYLNN